MKFKRTYAKVGPNRKSMRRDYQVMLDYDPAIHRTVTHRIHEYGWEFVCPTCGYRARFTSPPTFGRQQLEILNIGDFQARHVSSDWPVRQTSSRPVRVVEAEMQDDDDEAWLTPELRQQMEELLADVDLGD
jgi:hypothetical protein